MRILSEVKQISKVKQKGFTFVELLIIMIVVAILSGIGIQFVLSTQEDKAKLTNAKSFLAKDVPTAIYSCILRLDTIISCDATALINENIDTETEWGDTWTSAATATNGSESVTLCYILTQAGATKANEIGSSLVTYLSAETSWEDNGSSYTFLNNAAGSGIFTDCGTTTDQFVVNYVTRN